MTVAVPRYKHRAVSLDERAGLQIADPLDPDSPLPEKCGDCGAKGSIRNPLMMKPFFRMDHGGPKGTLYQSRCADCQVKRVRRR